MDKSEVISSATDIKAFFETAKKHEVEFIDFRFTDISGTWHHMSYTVHSVSEDTFKEGLPLDGSSIPYWQSIEKSDLLMIPDAKTAFMDPFTADATLVVFCDIWDIYNNQPYAKCPRTIAKNTIKYLNKIGLADTAYFGPENEFFIFDDLKIRDDFNCQAFEVDAEEGIWNSKTDYEEKNGGYNTGHRSGAKGGYYPVAPRDTLVDIRAEIIKTLEEVGLECYISHHEVGQSQCELGVKFDTLVNAADNVQKLKYVVKMVAHLNGKTATFMPKPLFDDNGNGMHVHQSLWKDGKNLFAGNEYQGLSETALHYIGGVLGHAKALAAFTNATTNSYKRLMPGFEAPSILAYSGQNRSASCRIPYTNSEKAIRAEFRFPDSTANPYLAFSSMLLAGIDGINNKTHPGDPREENLFEYSLDKIREENIEQMPPTLRAAVEALLKDHEFLRPSVSEEFVQNYKAFKFETQIYPFESRPHPVEFLNTYSC